METPAVGAGGGRQLPGECNSCREAQFAHINLQKRSVSLVLVGASSGFLGFVCSTIIGIHKFLFTETGTNYLGETFASGNNYRPQTVSQMVHDPGSPEGKAFFAFSLMGAICILTSWYAWQLRNVYVGSYARLFGRCGPMWANIRHYVPPLGMLLVVCIPVAPPGQRDFGEVFAKWVHTLGALAFIGGYGMAELHCLFFAAATRELDILFKPGEWRLRVVVLGLSSVCGVAFQVCGIIAEHSARWPCADDWRRPTADELALVARKGNLKHLEVRIAEAIRNRRQLLYNTASAECLGIKAGEFWFEVLAGFFVLCSLWTIGYYSLERHIPMPQNLPAVPRDFLRMQGYAEDYVRRGCGRELPSLGANASDFDGNSIGSKCEGCSENCSRRKNNQELGPLDMNSLDVHALSTGTKCKNCFLYSDGGRGPAERSQERNAAGRLPAANGVVPGDSGAKSSVLEPVSVRWWLCF